MRTERQISRAFLKRLTAHENKLNQMVNDEPKPYGYDPITIQRDIWSKESLRPALV